MTGKCNRHELQLEITSGKWLRGPQGSFLGLADCPKCQEEYRQRWFCHNVRESHIPPRFVTTGFDDYETSSAGQRRALATSRDYVDRFEKHLGVGRCLVFCGKPGTGKTHLGCAIGTSLIRASQKVFYTTAAELIRSIRSTWRKGSDEDEASILRRFQLPHLLILDEAGFQFGSDAEVQQLGEVIDLRYQQTKPTLVISNYSLGELPKYLGERGVDRLRDNGGQVVVFDWVSRRGQNAN